MKKLFTMICIATMLVMACSLSGCGKDTVKETAAQQINYTERTFTIVDKLVNNKITDFYSYFDENMKKQVSQADVQQIWASLISDYGAFDYYKTDITLTTKDGYQIVDVPVIFKNGSATLRFALNAKGEISGFFITDNATASNSMQLANDTEVTFGSAEYPISGSLTLPEGEGPFPAVILVHGSGPSDRNEQIGPNLPFMDLAEQLSAQGVAVLRYDKRTYLYGNQLAQLTDITVQDETIDDVVYALDYLQTLDNIDTEHIYIAGHSLGGYLIPRIAAQTPEAAGYILLAASARPMEDLLLEQTEYILSLEKSLDDASKEKLLRQTQDMVDIIKSLTPDSEYTADQLGGTPASYWLDLKNYDPIAEVQGINKSFLVLQGGRDYQVTKTDYDLWQSAFGEYSDVHFRFYDNLNHLFMSGTGKSVPNEYQQKNTVDTVVGKDIANFVLDHAAIKKQ
ncbi:MAG: alpha/beta fold hydrolase [Peptococcaceae bacterium]|nr:alpha/beta fold hydrolase [Peptococcaceae bacterium]